MPGAGAAISLAFNWNPSYSYAKMPEDVKDPPDYWRDLTEPAPPARGLPHLRRVRTADGGHVTVKDSKNVDGLQ
jgi:hypothetical protein